MQLGLREMTNLHGFPWRVQMRKPATQSGELKTENPKQKKECLLEIGKIGFHNLKRETPNPKTNIKNRNRLDVSILNFHVQISRA